MAEQEPIPSYLVVGANRYLILKRYGTIPSAVNTIHGPAPLIPVYRAMKVVGDFTDATDLESLVVSLRCLYYREENGRIVENGGLYGLMGIHAGASLAVPSGCNVILERSSLVLRSTDLHKQAQFTFQEFPNIARGSMYSNEYFNQAKMTEDEVMYFVMRAAEALIIIHPTRAHGQICAAHIYQHENGFKLGFGATVVDLDEDVQKDEMSTYLPICKVWRWAREPEQRETQAATYQGDVWMLGILALELAYGGLRFENQDAFYARITEICTKGKLPDNLVSDDLPRTRKNRLFRKNFKDEFTRVVIQCLKPASERPTAAELVNDPYLKKCTHLPSKYFRP